MIIYLARHGETTGDIENRYGGDYDDHLTEQGRQQAAVLAEQLAEKQIQKLFSSPLVRAKETAAIIATKTGLKAEVVQAFKERNAYGILTGLTKEEAAQKYPEQVETLKDVHHTIEGAEEYAIFQKRVTSALESLGNESVERVAVITHGGPLKIIFRDILKIGEVDVADCAYIVLEPTAEGYKLVEQHGVSSH